MSTRIKRRFYSLILILPFLFTAQLPKSFIPVAWDLGPRTIVYRVEQQSADPATGILTTDRVDTLVLVFRRPEGTVSVQFMGKTKPSTMTPQGRLYPKESTEAYLFWELPLLAVLPPDGDARTGKSWTIDRPEDAEASVRNALVGQARVTYRIESVDPLIVTYTGMMRIAPSPGLDVLAADFGVSPFAMRQAATEYKPYLKGSVEFSLTEGSTLKAEGEVRPFAPFGTRDEVTTHPARIHYRITRM